LAAVNRGRTLQRDKKVIRARKSEKGENVELHTRENASSRVETKMKGRDQIANLRRKK